MLLIRELSYLVGSLVRFSFKARRPMLLLVLALVALAAMTATTVTVVGPIVFYPFL